MNSQKVGLATGS